MEDSKICLDIYPLIIKYCDYTTLENFKYTNSFCYHVSRKEKLKRLKTFFPFGELVKVQIVCNDINLEEINCIIDNKIINIPKNRFSMPCIKDILKTWFFYNFNTESWILTGKVIKSIIRLANKSDIENVGEVLTFQFKNKKSFLLEIN